MQGILVRAAIGLAALVMTGQASATIFQSNYTPSNGTATFVEHFHPLEYRAPDATQSFDTPAYMGAYCGTPCATFYSVTTEFVATSSYAASHLVVPLLRGGQFGNFRVGFGLSRYDNDSNSWVGLVNATIESSLLPINNLLEVELPFGVSGARFVDFNYQSAQIVAGERYRLIGGYGTGALGDMQWFLSDAAATGQSTQYHGGNTYSQANLSPLAFQPAFALTDGGALVDAVSAVPETSTWMTLLLGFGFVGGALRTRRFQRGQAVSA